MGLGGPGEKGQGEGAGLAILTALEADLGWRPSWAGSVELRQGSRGRGSRQGVSETLKASDFI